MPDTPGEGLGQFTRTAADLADLEADADARRGTEPRGNDTASPAPRELTTGITISDHLEAAGAARAFGFNGREAAAYVLGFWQGHLRRAGNDGYYDQPEAERLPLEMHVEVLDDHLPAVAATMVRAGASVDVHHSSEGGVLTLRVSSR